MLSFFQIACEIARTAKPQANAKCSATDIPFLYCPTPLTKATKAVSVGLDMEATDHYFDFWFSARDARI